MTAAYVIADVKVSDPDQYRHYTVLTPAAVAAAGGESVVRGGRTAVLEGNWLPTRVVVIRFESFEAAQAFYDSALYLDARGKRAGAPDFFNMIIVEGI
jgi:uncharacterized protein (DUF1330 family)